MADAIEQASRLAEPVALAIGGRLFGGWTSVSITRSIAQITGTFSLTVAQKAAAVDAVFPIDAGAACQVRIGDEVVIDGHVDRVDPSGSPTANEAQVTGRDRTADLADCSAVHRPGSWSNSRIEQIAAELAQPFGIEVRAEASTGAPIRAFALQQGETVQAAIERLLRFRGLLMVADQGGLAIVEPSSAAPIATLAYGEQIESWSAFHSQAERYSDYLVKGQARGSDDRNGRTVSQLKGEARDPAVRRYRPLLLIAEDQSDPATIAARARFEAGVRAGRGAGCQVTVPGWRPRVGEPLWRPNTRVRLRHAPAKFPDALMLIESVTFEKGANGTVAQLALVPPEAWTQLAEGEPR
ncbi:phage baseplate assembly protein [Sphingomonas sp. CJ99]